jgi:polyisoprenoid-binding protein YceI/hemerythrin superfamily protein
MTMSTTATRSELEESIRTILRSDHQRLEESFRPIVGAAHDHDPSDLHEAWQIFERQLLAHLNAEETHLLPVFSKSEPKQAAELLDEHARIRERAMALAIDLDLHCLQPEQVKTFVDELRAHAAREELVLYPWATRQLGKVVGTHLRHALAVGKGGLTLDQDWRIDPERSTLHFSLRHIVVREIKGEFKRWGGTISIDEVDPTKSRLRVWVDLASVDTAEPERDAQVRSAEFFDIARFPRATFASTEIRLPDSGNPVVRGRLQLHGTEGEVALEITRRDERTDDQGGARAIYSVTGRFDRRDFGLRWNQDLDVGGVVVGDQVQIEAHVEAVRHGRPRS